MFLGFKIYSCNIYGNNSTKGGGEVNETTQL